LIGSGDAPCSTTGCPGGNDYTVARYNIAAFNGNPVSGGWGIKETAQDPGRTGPHNEYSYNLSFQNKSGDFLIPRTTPCENCITGQDPGFVSMASGDFRPKAGSPAMIFEHAHAAAASKEKGGGGSSEHRTYIGALPTAAKQKN
jgi:hypothetical protein